MRNSSFCEKSDDSITRAHGHFSGTMVVSKWFSVPVGIDRFNTHDEQHGIQARFTKCERIGRRPYLPVSCFFNNSADCSSDIKIDFVS